MKQRLCWSLLAVMVVLAGCYTVPETGRRSMIVISPGEETQMGVAAFADIQAKEKISHDPAANERVQRVGKRIAEAVGNALPTAKWEFVVFDDPKTINAFALPGGKVGVYTGLLDLAATDAELAIVMGHEIGHVTARHGAERMSQGLVAGVIGAGVGIATNDSSNRDLWRVSYGLVAGGLTLMYSRGNESEADYIGIRYAAKAGYNPMGAITFWNKMAKAKDGAQPPKWLSTHPSHADRIAELQGWMPEVLPIYETARKKYE